MKSISQFFSRDLKLNLINNYKHFTSEQSSVVEHEQVEQHQQFVEQHAEHVLPNQGTLYIHPNTVLQWNQWIPFCMIICFSIKLCLLLNPSETADPHELKL